MRSASILTLATAFLAALCSGCGSSTTTPPTNGVSNLNLGANPGASSLAALPVSTTCSTISSIVAVQVGSCPSTAPIALLPTPALPASNVPATAPPNTNKGTMNPAMHLPAGFTGDIIANFVARELAFLPNGDLLAGTKGQSIVIVPNAEGAVPGKSQNFITLNDQNALGVAFGPDGYIYAATTNHLWKIPYTTGAQSEPNSSAQIIATYRQGGIPAGSDGDQHDNSSVAINGNTIYVGVGSSCNSCKEIDPTRATIQALSLGAPGPMTEVAKRIRNPLAMTINPATGTLWVGGPGQDHLPYGHPYEYMDPVTLHTAPADYGWPACEENNDPFNSGANCIGTVAPILETYAYSTHIGAAFYPLNQSGAYAFPQAYRGGLFVSSHGSWHCCPSVIPKVEFFEMNGDSPRIPVTWTNPTTQWSAFLYDTRSSTGNTTYNERFTGVAVGPQGSLFVGDDNTPGIYRIRP